MERTFPDLHEGSNACGDFSSSQTGLFLHQHTAKLSYQLFVDGFKLTLALLITGQI